MSDRFWTIVGYDAGLKSFEQTISVDSISESEVKTLLQRLVARGMTEDEVVTASIGSERKSLLELQEIDGEDFGFTTDQTGLRYYVATLSDVAA